MAALETSPLHHTAERAEELKEAITEIRDRVKSASLPNSSPTLIAVSKYKPASDIMACYELCQYDFGENYLQELVDKAAILPRDIRWHFIGALQSNKAKNLASIPNLYCVQTLASAKAASALNKAIPEDRSTALRVLVQVNTSCEETKSGLPPLGATTEVGTSKLAQLVVHIVNKCPRLRFEGLMTIGALNQSLSASETEKNADFETLKETRDRLKEFLDEGQAGRSWGHEASGNLILSMGMSSDFEPALKAGSDIVRVGTSIFGQRPKKVT